MFKRKDILNWFENQLSRPKYYLLKSCLSTYKDEFFLNWDTWKKRQNFEVLDSNSLILIPYLYKQLDYFKIEDENLLRYRGIFKKQWVSNTQNTTIFNTIFKTLSQQNIPFILSGNLVCLNRFYNDQNLFKTSTIEIYLNKEYFLNTIKILEKNEFHFKVKHLNHSNALSIFCIGRTINLQNTTGASIVICPDISPFSISTNTFYENTKFTQKTIINDFSIDTFSNEYELVRIIIIGLCSKRDSQLKWVLDAKHLLNQNKETFNWKLFLEIVLNNDKEFIIAIGINQLVNLGITEIPGNVIQKLKLNPSIFNYLQCNNFIKRNLFITIVIYFYRYKKLNKIQKTSFYHYIKALFYIYRFVRNKKIS